MLIGQSVFLSICMYNFLNYVREFKDILSGNLEDQQKFLVVCL
jgi:hypothetical protein